MFKELFFWLRNGKQAQTLALRTQTLTYTISALPQPVTEPGQDIVRILQSTCSVLEHFVEQKAQREHTQLENADASSLDITVPQTLPAEIALVQPTLPETTSVEIASTQPVAEDITPPARGSVSATAKDLMKLSDWVLLAKVADTPVDPKVLGEIYRRLTSALAKEGVTLLDETGLCDYERQAVVGTQPTDDPTQNDHIYSSISPGYLFQEKVIRPQEVIVYIHTPS